MRTVKLVIQNNRTRKNGETPIYVQYSYSREKRKLFKTGKTIKPEQWDKKLSRVKASHENAAATNTFLRNLKFKMEMIVDAAILEGVNPTIGYVEQKYFESTQQNVIIDTEFFDEFNQFLEYKQLRVSKDCVKDYNSLKKHLKGWEKSNSKIVQFESFDDNFFYSFVNYLEYELVKPNGEVGLEKNSVHKVIKNLKSFLNHCMRTGVCDNLDLSGYKVRTTKTQAVYVNEQELDKLLALDLKENIYLSQIRDLFIIGCETGLRYSDLSRLTWSHVDDNLMLIRMTVSKTMDKVVIPISDRLFEVLMKYDTLDRIALPTSFHMDELNKNIKMIAGQAGIVQPFTRWKVVGSNKIEITQPKNELISSHTCRRSFCTNQFMKGMPAILIRKISGHKKETTFLRYIKIDEEEAALKMLEYWENMGKT